MSDSQRPTTEAYLLNMLRRRDDVLWAGERDSTGVPTVIAKDVDAVRAQLPPNAGEGWRWLDSPWTWSDVKAAAAGIARLEDPQVRSVSFGPRDDETFGVTVEMNAPSEAVEQHVATLEPGLVRVIEAAGQETAVLSSMGLRGVPVVPPSTLPAFPSLDLGNPGPLGAAGLPPAW